MSEDNYPISHNVDPPFDAYEGKEAYIFVSYKHNDSNIVYPVIKRLHDEGFNIWFDGGIPRGLNYILQIQKKIKQSSLFINFITENLINESTNEKDFCVLEFLQAEKYKPKRVLPIFLENVELDGIYDFYLDKTQGILEYEFKGDDEKFIKSIIKTLKRDFKLEPAEVSTHESADSLFAKEPYEEKAKETLKAEEKVPNFNFFYLDNLIHNTNTSEILLEHDIHLDEEELDFYEDGIELDIDNLIIDGGGNIIDAQNMSRIFRITGNNVTVKNIIFKNAYFETGALVNYKSATLENCLFENNSSNRYGGAIYNRGSLSVLYSEFNKNKSNYGGGAIFNDGNFLEVHNSSFRKNSAREGNSIYNASYYQVKIVDSIFGRPKDKEIYENRENTITCADTYFEDEIEFNQFEEVYSTSYCKAPWVTASIFIDGTFNDMHAERDYLIKEVFPELDEWCHQRNIRLNPVDLRWGITEEDSMNAGTIRTCLSYIDKCRPFYMCFLGQRRGWVPDLKYDINEETRKTFPDIDKLEGRSVTEMGIDHALLRPLKRDINDRIISCPPAGHSLFFFRDPKYVESLSDAQRLVYTNEYLQNKEAIELHDYELLRTKHFISDKAEFENHKSGDDNTKVNVFVSDYEGQWDSNLIVPELSHYENGEGEGRLTNFKCGDRPLKDVIIEQLKQALAIEFSENMMFSQSLSKLDKEIEDQNLFCHLNSEGFIPRPEYTYYLQDYVYRSHDNKICLVSAKAGYGKTMLLSKFATDFEEERNGIRLYKRFCGISDLSSQTYSLWKSIIDEAEIDKNELFYPNDLDELKRNFSQILQAIADKGESLIIIDAVNQMPNGMDMLNWIIGDLPDNLKIIISIKEDKYDIRYNADLEKIKARNNICGFEIKELDDSGKRELIKAYLAKYLKALDESQIDTICDLEASQNLLFLKILLSELRVFGSFDQLNDKIMRFGDSPESAFNHVLERLEEDEKYGEGINIVPLLFSLLAYSKAGLSEYELVNIIETQTGFSEDAIKDAIRLNFRQVEQYMAKKDGYYDFFYESFKLAAKNRYAADEKSRYESLANYFMSKADPYENLSFICGNLRVLNELPYYLNESGNYGALENVLGSYDFIRRKLALSDINNLILDYYPLYDESHPFSQYEDHPIVLIGMALDISAPVLEKDKNQLPAQLWGRLCGIDDPIIKNLCDEIDLHTQNKWLKSKTNSLYSPESAIIKIIKANGVKSTTAIAMTKDRIISGSEDGILDVFDIENNELVELEEEFGKIVKIILIDEYQAIVGYSDGLIKIWDLVNYHITESYNIDAEITDICFLQTHGKIYASSKSGVYSVDLTTDEIMKLDIERKNYDKIIASQRNNQIILSNKEEVYGFDIYDGRLKFHRYYDEIFEDVSDSSLIMDSAIQFIGLINKFLIIISNKGEMKIWNMLRLGGSCESIDEAQVCGPNDMFNHAICMEDENQIITISDVGDMKLWSIPTPIQKKFINLIDIQTKIKSPTSIDYFNDGNERLVSVGNENNEIKIINLNKVVKENYSYRHSEGVFSIIIDGNNMITASDNGEIFTWDLDNEQFINKYSNDFRCNSLSYSGEDSRLAFAGVKAEKDGRRTYKIATCDVSEDMWVAKPTEYDETIDLGVDETITPNEIIDITQNKYGIVFIEEKKLNINSNETNLDKAATTVSAKFDSSDAFVGFEDGSIVEYPDINIFDAQIKSPVTKIKILDDKLIAGYKNGSVAIFDNNQQTILREHEKAITDIYVNNSQLISLSEDSTIKFWDMNSGECVYTHFLDIYATSINRKGNEYVIGDALGNVVFFNFEN